MPRVRGARCVLPGALEEGGRPVCAFDRDHATTPLAEAAKPYREMIAWATEIKVRAERRTGELLKETAATGQRQMANEGRPGKASSPNDASPPPTLADLGITRDQSSQWQKLAALPEREFEKRLEGRPRVDTRASGELV